MKRIKIVSGILLMVQFLCANTINYEKGLVYYESKQYAKALKYILIDAKSGHKASQYRLGQMYEEGLGTKVDYKASMHWYKQAASHYATVTKELEDKDIITTQVVSENNKKPHKIYQDIVLKETALQKEEKYSFSLAFHEQLGKENFERGNEFLLKKLDTTSVQTAKFLPTFLESNIFGLQAYHTNYILPFSYTKNKPKYYNSLLNANSPSFEDLHYDKNIEVEFQFSLRKQLTYNLFGWDEFIYAAYTQKVWWQLYSESAPFRETNYAPELFLSVPTTKELDEQIGLKMVNLGFIHESNGQEGYRSRSWNRLYLSGLWQWDNLFLKARAWYRLPEDRKSNSYYSGVATVAEANAAGDDNPDILDYMGYGDIKFNYLWEDHRFGLLLRNNFKFNGENKGAVEFDWAHSVLGSDNTALYLKIFYGYGESLISYDEKVTRASFGFSFSPGLF